MPGALAILSLVSDSLGTCSVWPVEFVFMLFFPQKYFNFSTKGGKESRLRLLLLTHLSRAGYVPRREGLGDNVTERRM